MLNIQNTTVVVMLLLASLVPLGCGDDTVDPSNPDASAAHDGSVDASKPKDGGTHDGARLDATADGPQPDGEADGATGGE